MKRARKCDVTKALKRDAERMAAVEEVARQLTYEDYDMEMAQELADWWGISPWGMND